MGHRHLTHPKLAIHRQDEKVDPHSRCRQFHDQLDQLALHSRSLGQRAMFWRTLAMATAEGVGLVLDFEA